jgi:hypothetical protein
MLSLLVLLLVGVPPALSSCTRITSDAPLPVTSGCYIVNIAQPGHFTIAARNLDELTIEHIHSNATVTFSALANVWAGVTRVSNVAGAVAFPLLKTVQVLAATDCQTVSMPLLESAYEGATLVNITGAVSLPKLQAMQMLAITDCRIVSMPLLEYVWQSVTISGVVGRIDLGLYTADAVHVTAATGGVARPGIFLPRMQRVYEDLSVTGGAGDVYVRLGRTNDGQ